MPKYTHEYLERFLLCSLSGAVRDSSFFLLVSLSVYFGIREIHKDVQAAAVNNANGHIPAGRGARVAFFIHQRNEQRKAKLF